VLLTDKTIRSARHSEKPVRLFDGGGLYLELAPRGGKWWRLKYRFAGKEKRLSLGVYPHVTLKAARARRDDAKRLLANGMVPSVQRLAHKAVVTERAANSFEAVAREWFAAHSKKWVKGHSDKILKRLELNVFPLVGGRPIAEVTAREVLGALRKVEGRGAVETAHRARQSCSQVFRYAVATEWFEFDLHKAEWRIPAARMKMREQHIAPLSRQAVAVLTELHALTGRGKYVFPGARTNGRPMGENTVNAALRRLGYAKDEMTGHGFRSMASTLLNEDGWNRDAIERQLAHAERDNVRAAYNFAEYLPERRRMMQAWADRLDALRAGAKVTACKRAAA